MIWTGNTAWFAFVHLKVGDGLPCHCPKRWVRRSHPIWRRLGRVVRAGRFSFVIQRQWVVLHRWPSATSRVQPSVAQASRAFVWAHTLSATRWRPIYCAAGRRWMRSARSCVTRMPARQPSTQRLTLQRYDPWPCAGREERHELAAQRSHRLSGTAAWVGLQARHRRTTLARLHRLFGMQENLAYHHATGVRVCHFPQELRSAIVGTAPLCGASLRALVAGLRPQDLGASRGFIALPGEASASSFLFGSPDRTVAGACSRRAALGGAWFAAMDSLYLIRLVVRDRHAHQRSAPLEVRRHRLGCRGADSAPDEIRKIQISAAPSFDSRGACGLRPTPRPLPQTLGPTLLG